MVQEKCREIIRQQTAAAMARVDRGRTEVDRRRGKPPRSGDLFTVKRTADYGVVWVVIGADSERPGRLIMVPADCHPAVGPWDVGIAAGCDQGALTLRCRCRLFVDESAMDVDERSGVLDPRIVKAVEDRWLEIQGAEQSGRMKQWEAEAEPEVVFAEKRARKAMSVLSEL